MEANFIIVIPPGSLRSRLQGPQCCPSARPSKMRESAVDESLERCPAFNALKKTEGARKPILSLFPKVFARRRQNRCLQFLRNVGMFRRQLYLTKLQQIPRRV